MIEWIIDNWEDIATVAGVIFLGIVGTYGLKIIKH